MIKFSDLLEEMKGTKEAGVKSTGDRRAYL